MAKIEVLHLTPTERGELQGYLRKRNLPAGVAQRMRIVLLLDEGASYRDVIARGVFTSVPDLARKLRRYINAYSANAQPIRWKYSDVTRRIRGNDLAAAGH
jgi:hypothetical protein